MRVRVHMLDKSLRLYVYYYVYAYSLRVIRFKYYITYYFAGRGIGTYIDYIDYTV